MNLSGLRIDKLPPVVFRPVEYAIQTCNACNETAEPGERYEVDVSPDGKSARIAVYFEDEFEGFL